jgi:hypothetical protein
MIYTRWGSHVTVLRRCGQHQPEGFEVPATLLLVEIKDPEKVDELAFQRFRFLEFLRADGGLPEIIEAAENVPVIKLDPDQLKVAIKEAL